MIFFLKIICYLKKINVDVCIITWEIMYVNLTFVFFDLEFVMRFLQRPSTFPSMQLATMIS